MGGIETSGYDDNSCSRATVQQEWLPYSQRRREFINLVPGNFLQTPTKRRELKGCEAAHWKEKTARERTTGAEGSLENNMSLR